jgi:hypothetical protein
VNLDWSWWQFGLGAIGAAAPEIIRLYNIVTGRTPGNLPLFGPQYFVVSLIFAVLGGLFAVVWGDNSPLKCLWVGVSLPVIICSLASQTPPGGPK